MALAVGILVDDATVEIENVHRNLAKGKPILRAILDGAAEIAGPAFVSTLCICIVFVPVSFIAGAAKSLFVPLALAVVFAMLTSYFLSRTLVPTLMRFLLSREASRHDAAPAKAGFSASWLPSNAVSIRYGHSTVVGWAGRLHTARSSSWVPRLRGASLSLFTQIGRDFLSKRGRGSYQIPCDGARPGLESSKAKPASRTLRKPSRR